MRDWTTHPILSMLFGRHYAWATCGSNVRFYKLCLIKFRKYTLWGAYVIRAGRPHMLAVKLLRTTCSENDVKNHEFDPLKERPQYKYNAMQEVPLPLPSRLVSLRYFNIWNNKLYDIFKLISFRLLCSLRIFLTILRRFATLSPSREEKSRETSGTRVLFVLVIEEVGRLGRLPSLLREGLYKTYLLVRARANLDSDALNKVGFTPLSTLCFSSKESLRT